MICALLLAMAVTMPLVIHHQIPFFDPVGGVSVLPLVTAANAAVGASTNFIEHTILDTETKMSISKLIMLALGLAMFFVEVCRGVREIIDHFRTPKSEVAKRRAHSKWATGIAVLGMAVIPMLYYGQHLIS